MNMDIADQGKSGVSFSLETVMGSVTELIFQNRCFNWKMPLAELQENLLEPRKLLTFLKLVVELLGQVWIDFFHKNKYTVIV